jgi:hypothetical protein
MGLLSRIMASTGDVTTSADLAKLLGREWTTNSGAIVSYDSAMQVADVYKCVRVVSEDMAKLPLHVYRRIERGRSARSGHWLQDLLRARTPFRPGFEFRETMQAHIELAGNAYAIKTVVRNETRELLPVIADQRARELLLTVGAALSRDAAGRHDARGAGRSHVPSARALARRVRRPVADPVPPGNDRPRMQLVEHGARLFKNGAIGGVLEHPTRCRTERTSG